jgi:uncharacterized protein (TIRG00374 family)
MKTFHRISLFLGLSLFAVLLWRIGPASIFAELVRLGWGLIPIILLEGVGDIFRTIGWRCCLSGAHRKIPFGRLYFINLVGYAINTVTPTATIGGEVTKGALLSEHGSGAQAVSSVIVGKLALASAQLLFAVAGSLITFWSMDFPSGLWTGLLVGSGILTFSLAAFFWVQKRGKMGVLVRWLTARNVGGSRLTAISQKLESVDAELRSFYNQRPWSLPGAIFWHILGFACGIMQIWIFLIMLGLDGSWFKAAGAWFVGNWFDLLVFMVPLDLGVQEGSRVLALKAIGYTPVLGMTYAMALRLQQIFWSAAGLLAYAVLTSGYRKSRMATSSLFDKSG